MNTLGTMRQDPAAIGQHNTTQTFTDKESLGQVRHASESIRPRVSANVPNVICICAHIFGSPDSLGSCGYNQPIVFFPISTRFALPH